MTFERSTFEYVLEESGKNVTALLNQINTEAKLLFFLTLYTQFNSAFAAGVINLAAQIAQATNFYFDREDPIEIVSDRSIEVAKHIFAASIDEFGKGKGRSHRAMAQDIVRNVVTYFNFDIELFNALMDDKYASAINDGRAHVRNGYCLLNPVTFPASEQAMSYAHGVGFHIGSEMLADQEFNLIEQFINRNFPQIKKYLEEQDCWHWIHIHTSVEDDHFNSALEAANLMIEYLNDRFISKDEIGKQILSGFDHFVATQKNFFDVKL